MKTVLYLAAFILTGCASAAMPEAFIYETSMRGEQGWQGASARRKAAASLTKAGVVTHPEAALKTALPMADIKVKRWGVSYFATDWTRYQVLMDADIRRDDKIVKCRKSSPQTQVGAMTLKEVRAKDGAALQAQLQNLVAACVAKVEVG